MANVAVRASTTVAETATSITLAQPTGTVDGDYIVCFLNVNGTETIADNNGSTAFTDDYQNSDLTPTETVAIFSRIQVSGDPTSYNFDWDGTSARIAGICISFSDPHTTPYDVAPSDASDNSTSVNEEFLDDVDILTVIANSIHVSCIWVDRASVTTTYDGTSYSEEEDVGVSGSQGLTVNTKVIVTPAQTGVNTYTMSTDSQAITQSFSIANNSGGGAATPHGPFGLAFHGPFGGPI